MASAVLTEVLSSSRERLPLQRSLACSRRRPARTRRSLVGGTTRSRECVSNSSGILWPAGRENIHPTTSGHFSLSSLIRRVFRTVNHCESFCRDTCARGAPEYDTRATLLEENPITGCSQSSACSSNYECKSIGSMLPLKTKIL